MSSQNICRRLACFTKERGKTVVLASFVASVCCQPTGALEVLHLRSGPRARTRCRLESLLGHLAHQVAEARRIAVIERRIHLVQQAERRRVELEQREHQRDRGQRLLTARQLPVHPGREATDRAVGLDEPVFMRRGEGAYVEDVRGRRYVDWVQSWGPLVFGHADPETVAAVEEATRRGTTFGAPTEAEVLLAFASAARRAAPAGRAGGDAAAARAGATAASWSAPRTS